MNVLAVRVAVRAAMLTARAAGLDEAADNMRDCLTVLEDEHRRWQEEERVRDEERAKERTRKRRQRNVPRDIGGTSDVSLSLLDHDQRQERGEVQEGDRASDAVDAPPPSGVHRISDGRELVTDIELPLPPELLPVATLRRIRDPAKCWHKFLCHHAGRGKRIAIPPAWAKWCADELDVQRDQPEARAGPTQMPLDWKAREARFDAEYAALRAEVAPPPPEILAWSGLRKAAAEATCHEETDHEKAISTG